MATTQQQHLDELSKGYRFGWHDPDHSVFVPKKGLSEAVVEEISAMKSEPDWMRKFRLKALKLDASAISVRHVQGPGCYGHNGADDAAADAATIAVRLPGRPIRVSCRDSRASRSRCSTRAPPPAMRSESRASWRGSGRISGRARSRMAARSMSRRCGSISSPRSTSSRTSCCTRRSRPTRSSGCAMIAAPRCCRRRTRRCRPRCE